MSVNNYAEEFLNLAILKNVLLLCSVTFKVNDVILLDGSDVVVVAVRMIVICMCSVSFRVLRGSA